MSIYAHICMRNRKAEDMAKRKALLKYVSIGILCLFSGVGVYDSVGYISVVYWRLLCLPVPFASGWFSINVQNNTEWNLYVDLYNINDVEKRQFNTRERIIREIEGWSRITSASIAPGQAVVMELPSMVEPRQGVLLLSARAQVREDEAQGEKLAIYLLPGYRLKIPASKKSDKSWFCPLRRRTLLCWNLTKTIH